MIEQRWGFEDLGVGVGLRTGHFAHVLEHQPEVDFFEIISENFMSTRGRPAWVLDRISERYPVVMHGVGLSIGSTDPLNLDYLDRLSRLARRCNARWISDHLCWTGVHGLNTHDLLPMPYNEEALAHVVSRVRRVQQILERPILLENPSSYVEFSSSTMGEAEFLASIACEADCGILLDANNIYVSGKNHEFDPLDYLAAMPWDRVGQFHVAGHSDMGTHLLDTHIGPVCDEVWELLAIAHRACGGRAVLLEWDAEIPDFPAVHAEALRARQYLNFEAPTA